ncbi:MAG: hypothetical protein ACYTFK_12605 [Planctomycetota bacterium]|jgi:hypothetical protein
MKTLNNEDFQRIYTDKKFRNAVANAHTVCDKYCKPILKKALEYPREWAVSQEQIDEAKKEREAAKLRTIEEHKGELVLVGMGMTRKCEEGGIGNHRARGYFFDTDGRKCFIEVMKGYDFAENYYIPLERPKPTEYLMFDFAHYDDGEPEDRIQAISGKVTRFPFDMESVLNQVNYHFGVDFPAVFVDNYDLSPDDYISKMKEHNQ